MQATAQPGWAATRHNRLVGLALPPIVQAMMILADNDATGRASGPRGPRRSVGLERGGAFELRCHRSRAPTWPTCWPAAVMPRIEELSDAAA